MNDRQQLTVLKVTDILTGGARPKAKAKAAPKKEAPAKKTNGKKVKA